MKITKRASKAFLLFTLSACGGPSQPEPVMIDPPIAHDPNSLGTVIMDVDPATGTAKLTLFATSKLAAYATYPTASDGNPNTNPPGTFQAVTLSADLPGQNGCPAGTNCFDVEVTNFVGVNLFGVYLAVDQFDPPDMTRDLIAPDPVPPGVTAPRGGRMFGDLANGGSSIRDFDIAIPNLDPYRVFMHIAADDAAGATICELGYIAPTDNGCQAYTGVLGMDFDVNSTITITHIGVFDHLSNGIVNPISAVIWNRAGTPTQVTPVVTFTAGDPGVLEGGHRYKPLPAPLTLNAGFQGTIAADGFNALDRNGNVQCQMQDWTTDTGGGLVSYVGRSRFTVATGAGSDINTFPTFLGTTPFNANRYKAGSFSFSAGGAACMLP